MAHNPVDPVGAGPHQTRILVLCSGNSARSQMAEGVLKSLDSTLDVQSAGITPAARVNPHAIQAMKEIGIDISAEHPKPVQQFVKQSFDYVITVCDDADKNCPIFSKVFRQVRDDIRTKFTAYYRDTIAKTASHQTR